MASIPKLSRIFCASLTTVFFASCGDPHMKGHNVRTVSSSEAETTVLELDRAWGHAYVIGDINFVDRILSPDWRSWTDQSGSDKAAELAEFRAGHSKSLENIIDNARVRVYGDTAVVEARERVRFQDTGGEHWLTWHITDVFIRRHDSWQVVASHQSTIPNP
jgi:ketosteroid isomerase-like protein